DMHICIADNSNLIHPVSRAVCCAADKKRIRIVVLKCETAVRIWESRHCAQADARVVIGKGEDYLRRIRSHAMCYGPKRRMTCSNLRCFSNRSRFIESRGQSSYSRSCPHGKRANDGHTCEEQNGRESFEVRFHRIFLVFGFSVYICVGLFLAAVQMCFCSVKRKPRPKPARFLSTPYEKPEHFQARVLGG